MKVLCIMLKIKKIRRKIKMKTRPPRSIVFLCLCLFCFVSGTESQAVKKISPDDQIVDAPAAVIELRRLYKMRDFEGGYERGKTLVAQFPENMELKAWFVLNMARNEMSEEAVKVAEKLIEKDKENAWAWFALANAYLRNSQNKEAAPAVEKALKLMPDDEEFIFLNASFLLAEKKYDEIYAWLDKNSAKIKDKSRLLQTKANALYRQSTDGKFDEAKRKASFEMFTKALEISPDSVDANFLYGSYLNYDKRFAEAYPLLKKAAAVSPRVAHIREALWNAILNGQPGKTEDYRKTEVIADMNDLMRLHPDSVNIIETVSSFYDVELEMPDKKKELDAVILKKFPYSETAEGILIDKIRKFKATGKDKKVDEKKRRQLVAMWREFINRPKHYQERYLGEAYSSLFFEIKDDKNVSDAELLQTAENASKYPHYSIDRIFSMIAESLTERKMFREAEKFVNIGFEKVKEEIERMREFIKDEKELQTNADTMNAVLQAARGWIYFKENRLDEAEKELESAIKLSREISSAHKKLGEIYEAKNDFDKAETAYINAYSTFWGKENPNVEALKSLYRKRHKNTTGFDAYFETVKVTERAMRKERVLSAKIAESKMAVPFNLKNLEAKPLSFADLKGKIVVVNIWGTWCGPCVMEMPEFQELHKKYLNDKDVAILTINNDEDLETIRKFMKDKKYDFAVLRDENYLQTVGINVFPTTWFIDREGKIAFVKVGSSDKLLEEFGWRIEELRKPSAGK